MTGAQTGSLPGGFPGGKPGVAEMPGLSEALSEPKVLSAVQDPEAPVAF